MKKRVFLLATTCTLFAGPDIGMLIDYDAIDTHDAKVEEQKQIVPKVAVIPVVTAPIIPVAPIEPTVVDNSGCYTNSVDFIGGWNFTQSGSHLNDNGTTGIRVNKCITNTIFAQVGYDYVFDSKHKNRHGYYTTGSNIQQRVVVDDRIATDSSYYHYTKESTPLHRFYLNGLYEINNYNQLFPFIFAGIGYEYGNSKDNHVNPQGFFNTGGGLKYRLNEKINLITEARAIKKFDNRDLDIVALLGVGIMFGAQQLNRVENSQQHQMPMTTKPSSDTPPQTDTSFMPIPTVETDFEASIENDLFQENTIEIEPIEEMDMEIEESDFITDEEEYYIQIAAFFKGGIVDDSKYFDKLEESGLDYKIEQTTIKGSPVQLLLVGPYYSKEDARADLKRAKRAEKGAFIKQIDI